MIKEYFIKKKRKELNKTVASGLPEWGNWNNVLIVAPSDFTKEEMSFIREEFEGKQLDFVTQALIKDKKVDLSSLKYYSLFGELKDEKLVVRFKKKYDVVLNLFPETSVALEYFVLKLNTDFVIGKNFHENDGQIVTFTTNERSPLGLLKIILKLFKSNG